MPPRRALFIDATRLTAYRWQSGELCPEGQFVADSLGLETFAQYLAQQRRSHFYLLAEVVDEAFRLDEIPYVQGRDRRALLTRKLTQNFYDTPLNLALSLGRETSGRRDEKMLFAALTRPQHLDPWLAVLRDKEVPLTGIYSIPLIAEALIDDLANKSGVSFQPLLLVTLTSGGLRQIFFINGRLLFSRLLPQASASREQSAIACAVEANKTYHYLVGQRLIARGTPLTTLVLTHPGEISSFRSHCPDSEELHFGFIDLLSESRKLGLKTLPKDNHSETLFLHLMVRKPPRVQFAPHSERRFFHLWRSRFTLKLSGAMILLGCLLFAGNQIFDCHQLDSETENVRLQTESNKQRYAAILKVLPPLPTSIDRLVSLIARYDDLEGHSATFDPMVIRISQALQGSPGIQINRIDWMSGVSPDEVGPSPGRGGFTVTSDVYAQLPAVLGNDQRALLQTIHIFTADLRKDTAVEVRILKLPFDTASGKSLKSSSDIASRVDATSFSLRIVENR